jgi:hypothetical protein
MKRRSFLTGLVAAPAALVMPYEPEVIYSFPNQQGPLILPIEFVTLYMATVLGGITMHYMESTTYSERKIITTRKVWHDTNGPLSQKQVGPFATYSVHHG